MRNYERGHLRRHIPDGVGDLIAAARQGRRWSQQRLADRAGVTRRTVYRTEAGGTPDADTLMQLCGALALDVQEIVPAWRLDGEDDLPSLHDPVAGYRVRRRRRELGITLTRAAEAAGVSAATLCRFERLMSSHPGLLTPVHADDPEGPALLTNEGLATLRGFGSASELQAYCR